MSTAAMPRLPSISPTSPPTPPYPGSGNTTAAAAGHSSLQNRTRPTHSVPTGTYDIRLTTTNAAGSDVEEKPAYIMVSGTSAPVADFSGTPLNGDSYVTVQFTDLSTNGPTSWLWDFGDGSTSTQQNPSHTFLGASYYTVSLTATNSIGSSTRTKTNYIYVYGASTRIKVIKYAADGTTILSQATRTYQELEADLPVMGDGITHYYHQGPIFTEDPDPVTEEMIRWNPDEDTNVMEKDYNAVKGTNLKDICDLVGPVPPESRIRVKATDGFTKWFAYRNVYEYSPREGPMVITWWRPDDGYVPYYMTGMRLIWFANESVNPWGANVLGNWDWHEAANPNYWYYFGASPTTTGLSCQKVSEISIFTNILPPAADFKINRTSEHSSFTSFTGTAPLDVQFIDWSTNDPTSWAWDFTNDGTTDSTLERPSFRYSIPGTYTVRLTATNSAGSDSETKTGCIVVTGTSAPPVAQFSATPLSGTAPLSVTFTDASTNTPTSWAWDFGDGGTSTLQNPTNEFTAAGTYTVTLTATNAGGSDSETKTGYVTVTGATPPVAAFSATPLSGTVPLTVTFTDESTNTPTSWAWTFGDGSTSTEQNPSHTYNTAGTYTVTLTATNTGGSDGETKSGYITASTPYIDISITGSIANWNFQTETNEDSSSVDMTVDTNMPEWAVSVSDALNDNKPPGTAGRMAEWSSGSGYITAGESLTNALKVRSGTGSYVTLSGSPRALQAGTSQGILPFDIGIQQDISATDPALDAGNKYHIVITFTGGAA